MKYVNLCWQVGIVVVGGHALSTNNFNLDATRRGEEGAA